VGAVALIDDSLLATGPLVAGATGGSGTRVVARILREAGLFTGSELNESEDAWRLGDYGDRWINRFVGGTAPEEEMRADLAEVLGDHCAPVTGTGRPWGWKEPRSIYLLPFFHRHLPALRYLHVVRDGRDMAFSENQNQLRKHGVASGIAPEGPEPVRSIALWSQVNLAASSFGADALGERYHRIRFEDLCADPAGVAEEVLAWAGLDGDASAAVAAVAAPTGLGRWRHADPELVTELERVAGPALRVFGYRR
jgi:hypothetical protein